MRKTSVFLILLTLMLCVTGCGAPASTQAPADPLQTNHNALYSQLTGVHAEMPYEELFTIYNSVISHEREHNCNLGKEKLFSAMLLGEWKDNSENYINYTYIYTNYDNTNGSKWYATNLATSKKSGNTYYFYTNVEGNNFIIGYEDRLTEEKTDNFVISFHQDSISVKSKIDFKTYTLTANKHYDKVQKGNARLAYIYIAKKIFSFKAPSSVVVTSCYVDYEEQIVYATIQATNEFGGTNNTDYKLYESNGYYYIDEYSHNYNTNIDLNELNQKLQAYVSSGG